MNCLTKRLLAAIIKKLVIQYKILTFSIPINQDLFLYFKISVFVKIIPAVFIYHHLLLLCVPFYILKPVLKIFQTKLKRHFIISYFNIKDTKVYENKEMPFIAQSIVSSILLYTSFLTLLHKFDLVIFMKNYILSDL